MSESILQFLYLNSQFDSQFWNSLAKLKLENWKLNDSQVEIFGFQRDSKIEFNAQSFSRQRVNGILKNTNTIEEFKEFDKKSFQKDISTEIWKRIDSEMFLLEPEGLNMFGLLTWADLKKYRFYYWLVVPAFVPKEPFIMNSVKGVELVFSRDQVRELQEMEIQKTCIIHVDKDGVLKRDSLQNWKNHDLSMVYIGFKDACSIVNTPGWTLRNFLYAIKVIWKVREIKVVLEEVLGRDSRRRIVMEILMPGEASLDMPQTVGWEKNNSGKMGPRMVDLGAVMDPKRLAESAVDLNLKLIKWRAMPGIDLDGLSSVKCLLFGAGTLGCYTARTLMAWGVRHITFVDSGKVSFSNPVRQPLFTFNDCLDGGKDKATAAADALKQIFPGITTQGHVLNIPMPGHPLVDSSETRDLFRQIEDLVDSHDAIFLLTDSRESRWLPTLLGASKNKIVMNAALGFDSFLVMRHGSRRIQKQDQMGCYFCNDVVAPTDSLKDRTLDQQCTVTRPGLSLLASSLVTELFVSIINHPLGIDAPADISRDPSEPLDNPFGLVPHQIRGFLTHYNNLLIHGHAFNKCSACSKPILDAYQECGIDFLLAVINDSGVLEIVSGLRKLFDETKDVDIDWEE